jgi:glycosyltransferase involved in cell wall biosynthesis
MNVLRNVSRDELAFDFMVHRPDAAAYDEELLALGAGCYVCKWPSNPLVYARNFLKILREHGPYDVVHSHVHHFSGFVLLLAKLAGVPIRIAHGHNDTSAAQQKASGVRLAYLKGTERLIKYAATSGIAVSEKAAVSLFGDMWQRDRRWMISFCGIDFEPFKAEVDRAEVRRELGIPSTALVIGHVGRFDVQKNHDFLIDIFEQYKKLDPNAFLLLIGEGQLKREIQEKVRNLGLQSDVIFTGLRSDVPHLLKGAMNMFLFPSKFEGLGLAVVEAQAAGLKCLVSEEVPHEAKVSDGCYFFSLSFSAVEWAKRLESLNYHEIIGQPELYKFDIDRSILSLKRAYVGS